MSARNSHPLFVALGGVLGIVEALVPPLLFVVIFTVTTVGSPTPASPTLPWAAMIISGLASVIFIVVRLIRREGVTQAVAGLISVVASIVLTAVTNRAENNFLIGIVTNGAYGAAFLLSVIIGWPLVGIAVGFLTKRGHGWRQQKHQKRILSWLTVMWVGMFAIRLLVEVPLYLASNVAGLSIAKLILGLPLYAPVVLITWLFVRGMFLEKAEPDSDGDAETAPAGPASGK